MVDASIPPGMPGGISPVSCGRMAFWDISRTIEVKHIHSTTPGVLLALTLLTVSGNAAPHRAERIARQAELDAACEAARDAKLQTLRSSYVEECVRDEGKDRAYCEEFYVDYGAGTGNRGPMFYDLPECATAFDYQKSQRRSSR